MRGALLACSMLVVALGCGDDDRRRGATDGAVIGIDGAVGDATTDCTLVGCDEGFECNMDTMACQWPEGPCDEVGCPPGEICNKALRTCAPPTENCGVDGCPPGLNCNTVTGMCEEGDTCLVDVVIRQNRRCDPATTACITAGGDVDGCIAMDSSPAVCRPCIENNVVSCGNMLGCQTQWDLVACCRDVQCGGTFDPTCRDDTCSRQWDSWGVCFEPLDFTQCSPHIEDCADIP